MIDHDTLAGRLVAIATQVRELGAMTGRTDQSLSDERLGRALREVCELSVRAGASVHFKTQYATGSIFGERLVTATVSDELAGLADHLRGLMPPTPSWEAGPSGWEYRVEVLPDGTVGAIGGLRLWRRDPTHEMGGGVLLDRNGVPPNDRALVQRLLDTAKGGA